MHLHLVKKIWRLPQAALKRFISDLLRLVLLSNRPRRMARAGFVLPTTVLLTLMVVLTVTALTYRSFSRSDQAIGQREQRVIVNAATPAIDRGKAKIEFMFRQDPRFPSGLPSSDILYDLMSTKLGTQNFAGYTSRVSLLQGGPDSGVKDSSGKASDPYTLPDETRVDINNDGLLDNAWSFTSEGRTVVYSILVDDAVSTTEATSTTGGPLARPYAKANVVLENPSSQTKADALVTRTAPLAVTEATSQCQGALSEGGWQVVAQGNTSDLQKNFQINAFVANNSDVNQTFETLEFQQSRQASRASKWGAWFRYDLEIFPGPPFNWNGAMHTDSNLLVASGNLSLFMVSAPASCVYSREASEISVGAGEPGINFRGQVVKGTLRDNDYSGGDPTIHVFTDRNTAPETNRTLTNANHSVTGGTPYQISANALKLFTEDKVEHIIPPATTAWQRRAAWDDPGQNNFLKKDKERTVNKEIIRPFVDDFYRADNRWGPKPRYDNKTAALDMKQAGKQVGDTITGLGSLTDPANGLDGYWERQAIKRGLRLIVGQRLELGNPVKWGNDPTGGVAAAGDPLYPATAKPAAHARFGGNHEYLQRKSLRDNLAAVQGMVVYHYQGAGMSSNGEFPAACVALTAHPGTNQTIIDSRTFSNYTTTSALRTDFLTGKGTNGWEFQFPDSFNTEAEFANELAAGKPLGNALRNLANFAGDPKGGAPSFKPVQDSDVHPAPFLSMWGDFSPLRRIFKDYLDASPAVAYKDLSPADKATLHSAACTMSLLAYNLKADLEDYKALLKTYKPPSSLQNVTTQVGIMVDGITDYMVAGKFSGNTGQAKNIQDALTAIGRNKAWDDPNPNTVVDGCPTGTDKPGFQPKCDAAEFFSDFSLSEWISLMQALVSSLKPSDITDLQAVAQDVNRLSPILRDRDLGFRAGNTTQKINVTPSGNAVTWSDPLTEPISPQGSKGPYVYKTGCNPNIFSEVSAGGKGGKNNVVMAALVACSKTDSQIIRYPSLYYLFPLVAHDHDGTGYHQQPDDNKLPTATQPGEPYIKDPYVRSTNPMTGDPATYKVVGTDPVEGFKDIAAVPRSADPTTWAIPASTGAALTDPNALAQAFYVNIPGGGLKVPFLDKGVFDGREQLNNRVLDIDLEALTKRKVKTNGDFWLPANLENQAEGIVYAFREDAVREDEIVRPKKGASTTSATCSAFNATTVKFAIETTKDCQMWVEAGVLQQDPPLTDQLISLKPVDFIPDPQRRSYGFRLRTSTVDSGSPIPADLSGPSTDPKTGRMVGMTLVTDNSVYILGDFNLHSTNGKRTGMIEEFTDTLMKDQALDAAYAGKFYGRKALNTANFANLEQDHWRPAEILSDAIYVLSGSFRDGAVQDGFLNVRPSSSGGANSSYMNQNRANIAPPTAPIRESGGTSPVYLDRNGTYYLTGSPNLPFYSVTQYNDTDWTQFTSSNRDRNLQTAGETFVNAVFVGGIVPKRPLQSYGGIHNYPRFLERWSGVNLFISGAFIQLNFSTTATGPFEQDAWEPGTSPTSAEPIGYYTPPNRRWGYDVGLLYVPPAPAARRFVTIGSPRSEYYRELPADDPYVINLRCAKDKDKKLILSGLCPVPAKAS